MSNKRSALPIALAAVCALAAALLASPGEAGAAEVRESSIPCPNAYCYEGTDECKLVYNSVCFLGLNPCDNMVCQPM
jgi:hypothetical protein